MVTGESFIAARIVYENVTAQKTLRTRQTPSHIRNHPHMKSILSYSLLAAAMAAGVATAQTTATTTPVGYTTVSCLPNADTIVGIPLRQSASGGASLASAPVVSGSSATLSVAGTPFTSGAFNGTHYVKFSSGANDGKWFAVTSNTNNSLVVDLNGDSLAAVSGDQFEVIKFWTLAELFNPALSTGDPATTGNAIVSSASLLNTARRTEVLVPNTTGAGINLAASATYFVNGGIWKRQGASNDSFNNTQLWPDTYLIIRNPAAVTVATKYVVSGEVETKKFAVPLSTRAGGSQDNYIALPRPIDIKLSDLNLGGTSAFVASTNMLNTGRRDELLVYNNMVPGLNKAASATYYFHDGVWKRQGNGSTDVGADLIPAGSGVIIRKYQAVGGSTAFWTNSATY